MHVAYLAHPPCVFLHESLDQRKHTTTFDRTPWKHTNVCVCVCVLLRASLSDEAHCDARSSSVTMHTPLSKAIPTRRKLTQVLLGCRPTIKNILVPHGGPCVRCLLAPCSKCVRLNVTLLRARCHGLARYDATHVPTP